MSRPAPNRRVARRLLGQPGDGAANATGTAVGVIAQQAPVPVAPQLEQRSGKQRQAAGLLGDIGDEGLDERALDLELCAARGKLDRADEIVPLHRPHQHVVGAEQLTKARMLAAAAVEVDAERDDHSHPAIGIERRADERVEERGSFLGIVAVDALASALPTGRRASAAFGLQRER